MKEKQASGPMKKTSPLNLLPKSGAKTSVSAAVPMGYAMSPAGATTHPSLAGSGKTSAHPAKSAKALALNQAPTYRISKAKTAVKGLNAPKKGVKKP